MAKPSKILIGVLFLLSGLCQLGSALAFKLITEEEAKLPDDIIEDRLRDPFPGPVGPVINILGCPKEPTPSPWN
ncbi:hypothetical protein [Methylomagnum sp.]